MTKNVLHGYNFARSIEKDMDSAMKKANKSKDKQTSSYQIFSRAACNFVFPKNIERPYPKSREHMNEDDMETYTDEEKTALPDGRYEKKEEETKDEIVCLSVLEYYDKCYEYEKIGKDNIKFLNLTDLEYNDKVIDLIKKTL